MDYPGAKDRHVPTVLVWEGRHKTFFCFCGKLVVQHLVYHLVYRISPMYVGKVPLELAGLMLTMANI